MMPSRASAVGPAMRNNGATYERVDLMGTRRLAERRESVEA
jgi:hypothetical protein